MIVKRTEWVYFVNEQWREEKSLFVYSSEMIRSDKRKVGARNGKSILCELWKSTKARS